MSRKALKYEVEVTQSGRVELDVPYPAGARLVVFVVEESSDTFADLTAAAGSSLDFWDDPLDDRDCNDD